MGREISFFTHRMAGTCSDFTNQVAVQPTTVKTTLPPGERMVRDRGLTAGRSCFIADVGTTE